jgi:hypothetical protein
VVDKRWAGDAEGWRKKGQLVQVDIHEFPHIGQGFGPQREGHGLSVGHNKDGWGKKHVVETPDAAVNLTASLQKTGDGRSEGACSQAAAEGNGPYQASRLASEAVAQAGINQRAGVKVRNRNGGWPGEQIYQ